MRKTILQVASVAAVVVLASVMFSVVWEKQAQAVILDTTAPRVTSTVPTNKATGVDPTTNITATFSEDMLASSINVRTFKFFEKSTNTKLAAEVSYDESTDTATLDPIDPLQSGVTYRAVVTTKATDLAGNPLDQNSTKPDLQQKRWSFTVAN